MQKREPYASSLPYLPDIIRINRIGLQANTKYMWQFFAQKGQAYQGYTITDADGMLEIPVKDNVIFPPGLFNQNAGAFTLYLFLPSDTATLTAVSPVIDGDTYPFFSITFYKVTPETVIFLLNTPVYTTPAMEYQRQDFVATTTVAVIHNLGYKPSVDLRDENDEFILEGYEIIYDSDTVLHVNFDTERTGSVIYN